MQEGGVVSAPWGYQDFCKRHPDDCSFSIRNPVVVSLTSKRVAELAVVQTKVNRRISYATNSEVYAKREYWAYPYLSGDCEDFAIEKRRRLISAGWPRSALLLTAARMASGQKHLVLVVVTDKGDFVLDNASQYIRHWKSTNYQWLARQSRFNESGWVALELPPEPIDNVAAP